MPRTCTCGGQFVTTSWNAVYFKVKCDRCGKTIKQRKRQPKK